MRRENLQNEFGVVRAKSDRYQANAGIVILERDVSIQRCFRILPSAECGDSDNGMEVCMPKQWTRFARTTLLSSHEPYTHDGHSFDGVDRK